MSSQPKRGKLARAFETREAARREAEFVRQDIVNYYADQKRIDTGNLGMQKDDARRKEREAKERQIEAQMMEQLYISEKQHELATQAAEEQDKVANELLKRHQERERKEREIAKIRAQSEELRHLSEKIRTARVTRGRELQRQHQAVLKEAEKAYETSLEENIEGLRETQLLKLKAEEDARRQAAIQAKHAVQQQIVERQEAIKQAEEAHVKEKAMVDEVVRMIIMEDQMETEQKRKAQAETKAFIEQFLIKQQEMKEAQLIVEAREIAQIEKYRAKKAAETEDQNAQQAVRQAEADRIYDRLRREKEEALKAQAEEEKLLLLVRQEEEAARVKERIRQREEKAAAQRKEMIAANQYQLQIRKQQEAALKQQEEDLVAQLVAKWEADTMKEKENADRRQQLKLEQQEIIRRQMVEKQEAFEASRRAQQEEEARQAAEQERVKRIVQEERMRLLQEAADVKDYFPRGVVQNKEEWETVQRSSLHRSQQEAQEPQVGAEDEELSPQAQFLSNRKMQEYLKTRSQKSQLW